MLANIFHSSNQNLIHKTCTKLNRPSYLNSKNLSLNRQFLYFSIPDGDKKFKRQFASLNNNRERSLFNKISTNRTNQINLRKYDIRLLSQGSFATSRHIGPTPQDQQDMLKTLNCSSMQHLIDQVIPESVYEKNYSLSIDKGLSEFECAKLIDKLANKNKTVYSLIGMGFHNTHTPSVIVRNFLENPGWYTAYTPYQAEISQGRLELLFNFQTMINSMTGLSFSNSSLLDQSSACNEAISIAVNSTNRRDIIILNSSLNKDKSTCFSQDLAAIFTKSRSLNLNINMMSLEECMKHDFSSTAAILIQNPDQFGYFYDYKELVDHVHSFKSLAICCADLLSLAVLKSPKEMDFDICIGSSQRFGVPLGFGGPHAAFISIKDSLKRLIPGRIVGKTKNVLGGESYRLTLQAREQHIRREKALSNICTSQVLLANIACLYAMHHGPDGLRNIALRVNLQTIYLAETLKKYNYNILNDRIYFDTIVVELESQKKQQEIIAKAQKKGLNFRLINSNNQIGITLDECVDYTILQKILDCFDIDISIPERHNFEENDLQLYSSKQQSMLAENSRQIPLLPHKIFNKYHNETNLMRYLKKLENKDVSLVHSMIPLGSCTMKLNSAISLMNLTNPKLANVHPYAPSDQVEGYFELIQDLEKCLCEITAMEKVSFHSNSGAQGEYLGLLTIKNYFKSINQSERDICLIPKSAHGTNPASAKLAGFNVVNIDNSMSDGGIDMEDLRRKLEKYSDRIGCIMITFPSTYGIFDTDFIKICELVHQYGGLVYMDGANMNAQVGLCYPGKYGVDVCHLNLHKTFSIPHGGGGPGMGPICVNKLLAPHLPKFYQSSSTSQFGSTLSNSTTTNNNNVIDLRNINSTMFDDFEHTNSIGSCPFGSALILTISYCYIKMMGSDGLRQASNVAILNANYAAQRLKQHFTILFSHKRHGHEFIVDLRQFKSSANIEAVDVAKRLMDYGFHAPTMSFPIANTLMIEPTESESKEEIDRFCDAMINIRKEISQIENNELCRENNMLKNSPHPLSLVSSDNWDKPYTRSQAAYPLEFLKENKVWPASSRVDDSFGDRNLFCSCDS